MTRQKVKAQWRCGNGHPISIITQTQTGSLKLQFLQVNIEISTAQVNKRKMILILEKWQELTYNLSVPLSPQR
jgi:hypothetical protein